MPGIEMRIKVLVKLKAATRIVQFIIEPKRSDDYITFRKRHVEDCAHSRNTINL